MLYKVKFQLKVISKWPYYILLLRLCNPRRNLLMKRHKKGTFSTPRILLLAINVYYYCFLVFQKHCYKQLNLGHKFFQAFLCVLIFNLHFHLPLIRSLDHAGLGS